MALIHAYFDESYSPNEERFFSVAGYLFEADSARELDAKWANSLRRFDLPYFRMSACAHGNKPFDRLTREECIAVETEVIGHIKEHAKVGICTSISERLVLNTPRDPIDLLESAYTLLCYLSLLGVREWMRRTDYQGRMAYYFEAGDRFQHQANRMMEVFVRLPEEREAFRYAGHAFVDKDIVRPVQTADVLAWHVVTDRRHEQEGKGRRADFAELLKCWTLERRVAESEFLGMRAFWADLSGHDKELYVSALKRLGKSVSGLAGAAWADQQHGGAQLSASCPGPRGKRAWPQPEA